MSGRPRVVIVGGGFAGLEAAKALRRADVDLTLIDRRNHHLFQPLLYQVATAALSPADIAYPIRKVLRSQANATVLLGEVKAIDTAARTLSVSDDDGDCETLDYDYLIVATGATHAYFGHDEWAERAPGLKTVEDATEIRRRFLVAFERAEREHDEAARRAALTFVVVGGGPTGVELAGAISEIARKSIPRDFRHIDTTTTRVILVEGAERLLGSYPPELSASAKRQLEGLGVEVRLHTFVNAIDEGGVQAGDERIDASTVLWAAGVRASSLAKTLGAPLDESGRVLVGDDLTIPGHPEVFVTGDLAAVSDPETGEAVPGVAQGAIQMGRYAARRVRAQVGGDASPRPPFRYKDKGNMATIGRNRAVAQIGARHVTGRLAWVLWALIHVMFLIGFRNRLMVMIQWVWMYVFFDRGARLITGGVARRRGAGSAGDAPEAVATSSR